MSECNSPDIPERQDIIALCGSADLDAVIDRFNTDEDFQKPTYLYFALIGAVKKQQIEIARFCLEHGARVDEEIACEAALVRSIPLFELFLEYGWDINSCPGGHGDTVLPYVANPSIVFHYPNQEDHLTYVYE